MADWCLRKPSRSVPVQTPFIHKRGGTQDQSPRRTTQVAGWQLLLMVACLGEGPSVAPTPEGNRLLEPTSALLPSEGDYEGGVFTYWFCCRCTWCWRDSALNLQRELLDIVDKNKSAVIMAPKSSWKTYTSYCCTKRVLHEGNERVVMYVAPTKVCPRTAGHPRVTRWWSCVWPPPRYIPGLAVIPGWQGGAHGCGPHQGNNQVNFLIYSWISSFEISPWSCGRLAHFIFFPVYFFNFYWDKIDM